MRRMIFRCRYCGEVVAVPLPPNIAGAPDTEWAADMITGKRYEWHRECVPHVVGILDPIGVDESPDGDEGVK